MVTLFGLTFAATALLAQNPPAYFVVRGNIGNGDQFDPGFPYHFDTSTGGGSTSRPVPVSGWGTLSVSASMGTASATVTFQGSMDPVDASRICNFYYGCGWTPDAGTGYSAIEIYVRGPAGTPYHIVQNDSGTLFDSVTKTTACAQNNYANAQASSSWAGVNGSVSATTEHGVGGYCGIDPPKSGSASVSLPFIMDGSSTGPTITYNGETYSFTYWAQTVLSLHIYAEQDPDFTAISRGSVTVNVAAQIVRPNQTPPTAVIDPLGTVAPNKPVMLNGSHSYDNDGDSIVQYQWMIKNAAGTVIASPSGAIINNFSFPTTGTYTVTLTVTDSDGQTGTTLTSLNVTDCGAPQLGLVTPLEPVHERAPNPITGKNETFSGYTFGIELVTPSQCSLAGSKIRETVSLATTDCPGMPAVNTAKDPIPVFQAPAPVYWYFRDTLTVGQGLRKTCTAIFLQDLEWISADGTQVIPMTPPKVVHKHFITFGHGSAAVDTWWNSANEPTYYVP